MLNKLGALAGLALTFSTRTVSAGNLDEAKKTFDSILPGWCELDTLVAQASKSHSSTERDKLANEINSKAREVELRTEADMRKYKALMATLTKEEKDQLERYAGEKRVHCWE